LTPGPTEIPPSLWRRTDWSGNPYFTELDVDSVWGLEGRVLGLASLEATTYFPVFDEHWELNEGPGAVATYWGGTVVDDRVWFLAYTTGIEVRESSLRLAGTRNGGVWRSFGRSNLERDSPAWILGHLNGTWVVATIDGGSIEDGPIESLRWSRDGVRWTRAQLPTLPGVRRDEIKYLRVASTRDVMVIHALVEEAEAEEDVILYSDDGIRWRHVAAPKQLEWSSDLACSATRCVVTTYSWEHSVLDYPTPIAWVSDDGATWTPATTTLGDATAGEGIAHLAATGDGFIGIEGNSNVAWFSTPDGLTWKRVQVLPSEWKVQMADLAVSGDTIVALEAYHGLAPQGAWIGSLQKLREVR
jgi:hypothetical protein